MATREIPEEGYNEEKVKEFLSELSALTQKFGIAIHGCGCCGSPIVYGLKDSPSLPHGFGYKELKIDEYTYCYTVGDKWCVWI
jgi:hypothetical protein